MSNQTIETGGGAAVRRDVKIKDGVFVGRDQVTINITWPSEPFTLPEPNLAQLRADYLAYLRDAYRYLDFKGLPQLDKIAQQLPLDAVYVPLRARPEMPEGETWLRVAGRLWEGDGLDESALVPLAEKGAMRAEPVPADEA